MSVLIVEDDPALRRLLETLTARRTIVTNTVNRGDTALKEIVSGKYAAVVLDLMLPGLNGFEVLQSLSDTHPHLLSRIIVLTAVSQPRLDQFQLRSSIWELIRKPFDVPQFIETIIDCVAFHSSRRLPTREELSRWLEERSAAVGAKAGAIAVIGMGRQLRLHTSFGFQPGVAEASFPLPLAGKFPLCSAVRTGRPVWLASLSVAAADYPLLLPIWTANQSQAIAVVPLKRVELVIGAIGWSFSESQPFDDCQRDHLLQTASDCFAMVEMKQNEAISGGRAT